jgi:hypothetical protein
VSRCHPSRLVVTVVLVGVLAVRIKYGTTWLRR